VTNASVFLVGAGGHARACIDVIEQEGTLMIVGLTGQSHEVGSSVLGYPVLGTDDDIPALVAEHRNAVICVGQIKTPDVRIHLFDLVRSAGGSFPVVVSPRAYVSSHATVGPGTVVLHGAVVNAAASVGHNCIINSQALVEHDAAIGDHCHVATGALINSGVRVGDGTFIGSGSAVRQGVTIGERCVIGMGQRIFSDCAAGERVPRSRNES
jgi:sugar O-acyltransferase (sialic acid O-acetyltransferase NeuD family)